MSRKDFTSLFGDWHSLAYSDTVDNEYAHVLDLHQTSLEHVHFHSLMDVLMSINSEVLKSVSLSLKKHNVNPDAYLSVHTMPTEGKAKIRYCGAWAIAKVRNANLAAFRRNMYSNDQDTKEKAINSYKKKRFLIR